MNRERTVRSLAVWMVSGGLMAMAIYGLWTYRSADGRGPEQADPERVRGIVDAWCYRQLVKPSGRRLNETQERIMCDCVSRMFIQRGGLELTLDPQSPGYDPAPVQTLLNEIGGSCYSSAVWLGKGSAPVAPGQDPP